MKTNRCAAGIAAILTVCGATMLTTSFRNAPQEPKSDFNLGEHKYISYMEKPLTSEITWQIEPLKAMAPKEEMTEEEPPQNEKPPHYEYTESDVDMLAKLVYREAGACSADEQRLIVWTVFQRIDSTDYDFLNMNTIEAVVTAPYQFAYDATAPIKEDIRELCVEELEKWINGDTPPTLEPYAPTVPYLFFEGDGYHGWFRAEWNG